MTPDKSEFGGAGRSEGTGDVTLILTQSPDGEESDRSEFESKTSSTACRGGVAPPVENALICGRGNPSPTDKCDRFAGGKTSKFGFANASLREGGGIFAENDEGSLRDVRFLLTLPQRMLLHRLRRSPLPEGAIGTNYP